MLASIFAFEMNDLLIIFLIAALGYALGRVSIKGLSLGTSGILIVALIFGHNQLLVPGVIKTFGLIIFVAAVGYIAGPVFVQNFKNKATSYVLLGLLIIIGGWAGTVLLKTILNVETPLALGLMTGSLTSTPGLGAAQEATGSANAAVGYGIAYPFGVIGVVLFVEALPKILGVNMEEEIHKLERSAGKGSEATNEVVEAEDERLKVDSFGYFAFALAIILGILLGQIHVPLPGGASFSLGNSGGPLLTGLLFGHLRHIGGLSLTMPKKTMESIRELGLALFLMGTGTEAGEGIVEILQENGATLLIMGMLITLISMFIGYVIARKVFKLDLLDALGAITGGMTSTPALGALIQTSGSDAVGASYAATYPVALIMVVLTSQFTPILFP